MSWAERDQRGAAVAAIFLHEGFRDYCARRGPTVIPGQVGGPVHDPVLIMEQVGGPVEQAELVTAVAGFVVAETRDWLAGQQHPGYPGVLEAAVYRPLGAWIAEQVADARTRPDHFHLIGVDDAGWSAPGELAGLDLRDQLHTLLEEVHAGQRHPHPPARAAAGRPEAAAAGTAPAGDLLSTDPVAVPRKTLEVTDAELGYLRAGLAAYVSQAPTGYRAVPARVLDGRLAAAQASEPGTVRSAAAAPRNGVRMATPAVPGPTAPAATPTPSRGRGMLR